MTTVLDHARHVLLWRQSVKANWSKAGCAHIWNRPIKDTIRHNKNYSSHKISSKVIKTLSNPRSPTRRARRANHSVGLRGPANSELPINSLYFETFLNATCISKDNSKTSSNFLRPWLNPNFTNQIQVQLDRPLYLKLRQFYYQYLSFNTAIQHCKNTNIYLLIVGHSRRADTLITASIYWLIQT